MLRRFNNRDDGPVADRLNKTDAGPVATPKLLLLIQDGEHFDGCTSYGGFLNKSYFGHDCKRGYDHEDIQHHRCNTNSCPSCLDRACQKFSDAAQAANGAHDTPNVECQICHLKFFGQQCLVHHSKKGTINTKSVCDYNKYCPSCCKNYLVEYKRNGKPKDPRHKCGWAECRNCEKHVEISKQLCFIQPVDEDDDQPKTKKATPEDVLGRVVVGEENEMVVVERRPPLLVYAEHEAITDEHNILIGYETSESN